MKRHKNKIWGSIFFLIVAAEATADQVADVQTVDAPPVKIDTGEILYKSDNTDKSKSCAPINHPVFKFLVYPKTANFYHQQVGTNTYKSTAFPTQALEIIALLPNLDGFVQAKDSERSAGFIQSKKSSYYARYGFFTSDFMKMGDTYYPAIIGIGHAIKGEGKATSAKANLTWNMFKLNLESKKIKGTYSTSKYGIISTNNQINFGVQSTTNFSDDKSLNKWIASMNHDLASVVSKLENLNEENIKKIKLKPQYIAVSDIGVPSDCLKFIE